MYELDREQGSLLFMTLLPSFWKKNISRQQQSPFFQISQFELYFINELETQPLIMCWWGQTEMSNDIGHNYYNWQTLVLLHCHRQLPVLTLTVNWSTTTSKLPCCQLLKYSASFICQSVDLFKCLQSSLFRDWWKTIHQLNSLFLVAQWLMSIRIATPVKVVTWIYFSQNRLTELHERLEPDLNEAKNNGVSLTEWRMISKLERNERQRQEIRKEYVRVLARNLASPIEEQRGFLLDAYLDKVDKIFF